MNKQEYREYIDGLNRTDDKNSQIFVGVNQQHALLSKMMAKINEYETSIYEPNKKSSRSETTRLIQEIEDYYQKIESYYNLVCKTAAENLKNNELLHGPHYMKQHEYNQNAKFMENIAKYFRDYAHNINTMCNSRENLMPKAPKTLEQFIYLSSMASQYAWVKPDYRAIEDPYDRKTAERLFYGFNREAPKFKMKVVRLKGNSLFVYNPEIIDNPALQALLRNGERSLNSPTRMITSPSYKFAKRVMNASKLFGEYVREGIDYYKEEPPRNKEESPIRLARIKKLCNDIKRNPDFKE